MNWRFIFFLIPTGMFMATLTVLGVGNPWISTFWVFFCVLAAYTLVRYNLNKWFLTALTIGTLWGVLHNTLAFIFFDTALDHHPGYENTLTNPEGIPKRYWVLLTGPLTGLGAGVLIAIFTWLLKKVVPVKRY